MVYFDQQSDWVHKGSYKITYSETNKLYSNTPFNNTFVFCRDDIEMTLLFQPVIYGNASSTNGIGIFRNTSTSYKADAKGGHEYTPDYLIKIKCPKFTKYIIPDAKFSAPDNIKRNRLQEPVPGGSYTEDNTIPALLNNAVFACASAT